MTLEELGTTRASPGGEPSLGVGDRPSGYDPRLDRQRVVDYECYDFRAVWRGRSRVDRFDRGVLELAAPYLDHRRLLELGTGFGRLTPQLRNACEEYVGADFDLRGLDDARRHALQSRDTGACAWVAANAYHLPFTEGAFSSVCMVRVFHHLDDPLRALSEVARVLAPGGTALVSYTGRSHLGAAVHDARVLLRRPKVAGEHPILRAPPGHVEVRSREPRMFVTSDAAFRAALDRAGLEPVRSFGGAETTAVRLFPIRWGLLGSRLWPSAPVFSARWVVVRKPGEPAPLPGWDDVLACPRCSTPMHRAPSLAVGARVACGNCGFAIAGAEGLVDGRYAPAQLVGGAG